MARRRQLPPAWTDYARELGHNLKRAREALGLSQERVAARAGLSALTLQKYEKGESRPGSPLNPELTNMIALSQALETTVAALMPSNPPDLTVGR